MLPRSVKGQVCSDGLQQGWPSSLPLVGMRRARTMSARKDFAPLVRMMPLDVMMPTTAGLTLTLPAGGAAAEKHAPFGELVTIRGIKDSLEMMNSLQRPKKARACPFCAAFCCTRRLCMRVLAP